MIILNNILLIMKVGGILNIIKSHPKLFLMQERWIGLQKNIEHNLISAKTN
jgi:hypothetical protein